MPKLSFLKKHTWLMLAVGLTLIAFLLRIWNLPQSVHFLGDQGRDALIVSEIFKSADLVFIGPVTSVGNMYLGPFYYYFMLPFLRITYPSPLGPAYAIAVFSAATVFSVFYWGKQMIGRRGAFIAAALMTFSVASINMGRFSWNPNLAPFVSMAMMYVVYLAWKKQPRYWVLVGLLFSILLQLHYVTGLAGISALLIWFVSLMQRIKSKTWKPIILPTLIAILILALSFVPLMLFDYKHDWTNLSALSDLISSDQNFAQASQRLGGIATVLRETHGRAMHIMFEFSLGKMRQLNTILLVATIGLASFFIYRTQQKDKQQKGIWVVICWLLVGIIGLSFYQHTVFDHYISYLFPATFLLLGFISDRLIKMHWLNWGVLAVFFCYYMFYNVPQYSFQASGPTLDQLQYTADSIFEKIQPGEKYILILLSSSKDLYGMNYRYYLHTNPDKKPLSPENYAQADKLVLINEEGVAEDPLALPIYELVTFGDYVIADRYELDTGVEIIILAKSSQLDEGSV